MLDVSRRLAMLLALMICPAPIAIFVSVFLIIGAHLGWQDRLWARWTPLDGQERDDINPGDPPLRTRCRSASIGVQGCVPRLAERSGFLLRRDASRS